MFILKKRHQPGVYVPLRALFLVLYLMCFRQQDAQEFLRYLLEGLHEDVNRVTSKPKHIEIKDDDFSRYAISVVTSGCLSFFPSMCLRREEIEFH